MKTEVTVKSVRTAIRRLRTQLSIRISHDSGNYAHGYNGGMTDLTAYLEMWLAKKERK